MATKKKTIVIATIRPWNIARYRAWKAPAGYRVVLITKKDQLVPKRLDKLNPHYIFFPHWSWIIPPEVYERYECIVFHMTDLPFGRGGSPLQNLLVRGIYKTKVSALKVDGGLDTGPVYLKRPLDLSRGSAHELYLKLADITERMVRDILRASPAPKPQRGKPVAFPRRKPQESKIPDGLTGRKLYDFIRMLDAPEYPVAYKEEAGVRIEFRNARLSKGTVLADAAYIPLT